MIYSFLKTLSYLKGTMIIFVHCNRYFEVEQALPKAKENVNKKDT